jgi:hypothetical protein
MLYSFLLTAIVSIVDATHYKWDYKLTYGLTIGALCSLSEVMRQKKVSYDAAKLKDPDSYRAYPRTSAKRDRSSTLSYKYE